MRTMTAPSSRQAPRSADRPNPRRDFDLTIVRRADVRNLAVSGPPAGWLPPVHATEGDRRYPSRRRLRQGFAFTIDLVVHFGVAIAVVVALLARLDGPVALGAGVGTFFALSILDRIVLQRMCQATVGKLLTGLCLIRNDTGGPPTTRSLVGAWFMGFIAVVATLLS
jgi:hypothetical protein